ncbi:hypothetical protein PR048_029843 [Dryococelus australis]|uniref:Uncharacterized protein n=1 Tax=Dryococelus australis TaxID=614101 RepID=A0ABQ9G7B3_9NEOP|nr:hypothetical protein PR048_029843 [Dryococelus australis]
MNPHKNYIQRVPVGCVWQATMVIPDRVTPSDKLVGLIVVHVVLNVVMFVLLIVVHVVLIGAGQAFKRRVGNLCRLYGSEVKSPSCHHDLYLFTLTANLITVVEMPDELRSPALLWFGLYLRCTSSSYSQQPVLRSVVLHSPLHFINLYKTPVFPSTFIHFPRKNVELEDANRTDAYPAEGTWSSVWRVVACDTLFTASFTIPLTKHLRKGGLVVRLLTSHTGEQGSIPGGVAPGFSHVGNLPNDAVGRRVFSGISRFPYTCIPALLLTHLTSNSSALKIPVLRAVQISLQIHLTKFITGVQDKPSPPEISLITLTAFELPDISLFPGSSRRFSHSWNHKHASCFLPNSVRVVLVSKIPSRPCRMTFVSCWRRPPHERFLLSRAATAPSNSLPPPPSHSLTPFTEGRSRVLAVAVKTLSRLIMVAADAQPKCGSAASQSASRTSPLVPHHQYVYDSCGGVLDYRHVRTLQTYDESAHFTVNNLYLSHTGVVFGSPLVL